jgi:hypothetical protein
MAPATSPAVPRTARRRLTNPVVNAQTGAHHPRTYGEYACHARPDVAAGSADPRPGFWARSRCSWVPLSSEDWPASPAAYSPVAAPRRSRLAEPRRPLRPHQPRPQQPRPGPLRPGPPRPGPPRPGPGSARPETSDRPPGRASPAPGRPRRSPDPLPPPPCPGASAVRPATWPPARGARRPGSPTSPFLSLRPSRPHPTPASQASAHLRRTAPPDRRLRSRSAAAADTDRHPRTSAQVP